MAAEGVAPLAADARAQVGPREDRPDRLPGDLLLLRAARQDGWPEESRRGRSEAAGDLRETRSAASRARAARGRCGGCGIRQRFGRDDVQGTALRGGRDFLPLLRSRAEASGVD